MKGNHYKKNPLASRSYTHTFKAAADAAPLPFSSALVAAELRNMHLASCEFMRFTPYMRFVPRNLETSQDFSGLYYLMGVHPPPGLTLTLIQPACRAESINLLNTTGQSIKLWPVTSFIQQFNYFLK